VQRGVTVEDPGWFLVMGITYLRPPVGSCCAVFVTDGLTAEWVWLSAHVRLVTLARIAWWNNRRLRETPAVYRIPLKVRPPFAPIIRSVLVTWQLKCCA